MVCGMSVCERGKGGHQRPASIGDQGVETFRARKVTREDRCRPSPDSVFMKDGLGVVVASREMAERHVTALGPGGGARDQPPQGTLSHLQCISARGWRLQRKGCAGSLGRVWCAGTSRSSNKAECPCIGSTRYKAERPPRAMQGSPEAQIAATAGCRGAGQLVPVPGSLYRSKTDQGPGRWLSHRVPMACPGQRPLPVQSHPVPSTTRLAGSHGRHQSPSKGPK